MNPLTQIKNTQKISRQEVAAGYSDAQSWHARFKHSAYIFSGGLPYGLTEGDLLAVFSQYGEVVDVNLIKHKDSGKSRGFAFLAYEDQRSTNLAVDNLNGTKLGGRIITVDHVDNYKRKKAEMDGEEPSDSDDEDAALPGGREEEAAIQDAVGDGAQVVSTLEAALTGSQPAGPGDVGGGDEPWAGKSTVYALLNSTLPEKRPAAANQEEDPLSKMTLQRSKHKKGKTKKDKKEKKEKKVKKEKS